MRLSGSSSLKNNGTWRSSSASPANARARCLASTARSGHAMPPFKSVHSFFSLVFCPLFCNNLYRWGWVKRFREAPFSGRAPENVLARRALSRRVFARHSVDGGPVLSRDRAGGSRGPSFVCVDEHKQQGKVSNWPAVDRISDAPPRAAAFDEQCVSTVAPSVRRNGDSPIHSGRHLSRSRAASRVAEGRVKRRGR